MKLATTKTYKIELKNMLEPSSSYHFTLENDFFDMIDAPETRKGKLEVDLLVKKRAGHFVLDFHTKGHITITCDRCLDDMELPIDTTDSLQVKLGAGFADEGDIIVVPEEDGTINVAWFIYEFIALNIPIKHVHEQGKCNKGMMQSLKKTFADRACRRRSLLRR